MAPPANIIMLEAEMTSNFPGEHVDYVVMASGFLRSCINTFLSVQYHCVCTALFVSTFVAFIYTRIFVGEAFAWYTMHKSIFSYNLSRPYPYRWFTWLVCIGGLVATALFTVINVAADGYNLSVIYSTTPNKTSEDVFWFQKQPWSSASKISSTCQPETISLGDSFYTNKLALPYIVDSILQTSNGMTTQRPSFPYLNVPLKCNVNSIMFSLSNQSTPPASQSWKITTTTSAECYFEDDSGLTRFNVSTSESLDASSDLNSNLPVFLVNESYTEPSVFLGYRMIYLYQYLVQSTLLVVEHLSASASFEFGNTTGFDVGWDTMSSQIYIYDSFGNKAIGDAAVGNPYIVSTTSWLATTHTPIFYEFNTSAGNLTRSMDVINGYAQTIYSTIVNDLGQGAQYNPLATPTTGKDFLIQLNDLWTSIWGEDLAGDNNSTHHGGESTWAAIAYIINPAQQSHLGNPPMENADDFFEWFGVGSPRTSPTTIASQYLCQVPERKPWGSLLVSVIVADLVFLQVLWKVLNWVTTLMVERGNEEAKYCLGCGKYVRDDYKMLPAAEASVVKNGGGLVSLQNTPDSDTGEESEAEVKIADTS